MNRTWQVGRREVRLLGLGLALLAACRDTPRIAGPRDVTLSSALVTGDAARALGPDGRFDLHPDLSADPYPQISAATAREIAARFMKIFGPYQQDLYAIEHGASVRVADLTVCGRAFYAESAYAPLPPDVSVQYRKLFGPYWIITFCQAGDPAVSIALSAYDTDVQLAPDGDLNVSAESGYGVFQLGISADQDGAPISPERAVQFAALGSHHRVAGVPHLIMRAGGPTYAQVAIWRFDMEVPITVKGRISGQTVTSTAMAVASDYNHMPVTAFTALPDTATSSTELFRYSPIIDGQLGPPATIRLVRRADIPRVYEPAAILPAGVGDTTNGH